MNTHAQHPQHMIIVNAVEHLVVGNDITFEALLALAFGSSTTTTDQMVTLTYSRGANGNGSGSLLAGEKVTIKDGMVFDVDRTIRS